MPIDVPVPPINATRPVANPTAAGSNAGIPFAATGPASPMPELGPEWQRYMKQVEAWMRDIDERVAALEGP